MPSPFQVVVGLGNPGARYDLTRHNVGFAVVDLLRACSGSGSVDEIAQEARRSAGAALDGSLASHGWIDRNGYRESVCTVGDWSVRLIKPMTFMNRSGAPLQGILAYHKIGISNVVVVHDEIDIPLGVVRLKVDGGEGGHNGLRSISSTCGGRGYARVRVGVGKPAANSPFFGHPEGIADWVLSKFTAQERPTAEDLVMKATLAVAELGLKGLKAAQNRFN